MHSERIMAYVLIDEHYGNVTAICEPPEGILYITKGCV